MSACDRPRGPTRQRGFSLVEVLVGMVIAIIIAIAAGGSARLFTASQRQGVGVGGMSANVATALAALKSDISGAGLGFFGGSTFLCHKLDLSVGTKVLYDGAAFSPALITNQGASDQLDVMFASSIDAGAGVLVSTADTASATTSSLLEVLKDQAVLLAPAVPGNPCVIRTVTSVDKSTAITPEVLHFDAGGNYNQQAFTTTPTFAANDLVALLGDLHWSRYRVNGTDLLVEQPLLDRSASLLHNVLAFRVQYGIASASSNSTLGSWQDATGTYAALGGTGVDTVSALRIAIVTRSPQREKENPATTKCEASLDKPTLPWDPTVTVEPDVKDWQCYRYRSAVAIVPLRNMVW